MRTMDWRIAGEKMNITYKHVDDLIPYKNNPRIINKKAINAVATSIKKFGFRQSILIDGKNEIINGHTRHLAAVKLGMTHVPCVVVDDLTEEQIKALRIADNKVAEYSEWDDNALRLELMEIENFSLSDMGFEDEELVDLNKEKEKEKMIKEMELKEFEHYDYLVFVYRDQRDFLNACSKFGIEKVDAGYGKTKKIGIGRVLDGKLIL